jgi:hypothetical protein
MVVFCGDDYESSALVHVCMYVCMKYIAQLKAIECYKEDPMMQTVSIIRLVSLNLRNSVSELGSYLTLIHLYVPQKY